MANGAYGPRVTNSWQVSTQRSRSTYEYLSLFIWDFLISDNQNGGVAFSVPLLPTCRSLASNGADAVADLARNPIQRQLSSIGVYDGDGDAFSRHPSGSLSSTSPTPARLPPSSPALDTPSSDHPHRDPSAAPLALSPLSSRVSSPPLLPSPYHS